MKKAKWILALLAIFIIIFLNNNTISEEKKDNTSYGLNFTEFENNLLEYEDKTVDSNKTELLMSAEGLNWSYNGSVNASSFLANLMSQRHIAISRMFLSSEDPLDELANYNKNNMVHGWALYDEAPDNILKEMYVDTTVVGSLENMELFENIYGKNIGICIDFANFNASILRLLGVDSSDMTINVISGHVYVSFTYKDKDYMFDNNSLLVHEKDWIYSSYFDQQQSYDLLNYMNYDEIVSVYNDSNYLNVSGVNSVIDGEVIEKMNTRLSTDVLISPKHKLDKLDINAAISNVSDLEASQKIIELVYKNSTLDNGAHYNGAKYAFRSLLVKHPEYYLYSFSKKSKYEKNNHIIFDYADQYESVDSLLQSILEFKTESIYSENYRIMHPYEILMSKSGSLKDKAFILNILLDIKDVPSIIVLTDKNSYLYMLDDSRLLDMHSMEDVQSLEGSISLVFNRNQVYFPKLKIDTLSSNTRDELINYNIIDK